MVFGLADGTAPLAGPYGSGSVRPGVVTFVGEGRLQGQKKKIFAFFRIFLVFSVCTFALVSIKYGVYC